MPLRCTQRPSQHFSALPATQFRDVLAAARDLKREAALGSTPALLRGKYIALLCDSPDSAEAMFFQHAAQDLGAQVARIQPRQSGLLERGDLHDAARLFGRLYDAIECQNQPASLVHALRDATDVPVYDAIASIDHPLAELAGLLDEAAAAVNHRFVVQAMLVVSIGT